MASFLRSKYILLLVKVKKGEGNVRGQASASTTMSPTYYPLDVTIDEVRNPVSFIILKFRMSESESLKWPYV
jgi:hypothetical protein